ncbi:transglycosylase domain-containing protein [Pararhizobium mangrovi]|uniref:Penicillin-binding protein n=1 Tax=Pararhizobium mangrovi TaxID=2590452 RepID=A0A506U0G0_9HYPH|nr:transglycosylase domain-containing protein [Pararhizobium mangrovi]TPW26464.1 penicillin-binding protein [Pararhizobium mangrovi]
MAARKKTDRRVEPTFAGRPRANDDGLRIDAGERVGGGGRPSGKPRKTKSSTRRDSGTGGGGRGGKGGGSGGGRGGGGRRRRLGLFGWMRRGIYWCLVVGIWGVIGIGCVVAYYAAQMPSASTWAIPDRPPNVQIVSVHGDVMANRGVTGGEAVSLDEMSPYIPEALVSIEDRRFYSHFGVDPVGLGRALVTDIVHGHAVAGGSTITQQLAKNLFLSPQRTLERKIQELMLAFWLEHKFTKDQILDMYLNRVYFGSGAYGVQAAARTYFHEDAKDVTLAQAALIAGLVKAPSRLSPLNHPKQAHQRQRVVLYAMKDAGYIDQGDIDAALKAKPDRKKKKSYWTGSENYAADAVMDRLPKLIGDVKEDVVVTTTIDAQLQHDAAGAIDDALAKDGTKDKVGQGALVAMDGTGAVRALIGGRDYAKSQYNRAVDARRQPGSSFKPFVYTAAMEMGRTPASVRNDAPIKIGKWSPTNYEGTYEGPVTLMKALTDSINTVAAQLAVEVGPKTVVQTAHRLGIESKIAPNASIALGTSEVSLLELTSAYAPFMNGGYRAQPYFISKVTTSEGKVLYDRGDPTPQKVLQPKIAAEMDAMLENVVNHGTGHNAKLKGWQMGGKTGTTQNWRDALFVGFTANLVTGVWFGNDDGSSMKHVTGGKLPATAWHQFMAAAHDGIDPSPLPYSDIPVDDGSNPAPANDGSGMPVADAGGDGYPQGGNGGQQGMARGSYDGGYDDAPVPPANVGGYEAPRREHRSSLLDVLLGR